MCVGVRGSSSSSGRQSACEGGQKPAAAAAAALRLQGQVLPATAGMLAARRGAEHGVSLTPSPPALQELVERSSMMFDDCDGDMLRFQVPRSCGLTADWLFQQGHAGSTAAPRPLPR